MEIETKYTVPDEETYRRLALVTELAGAPLIAPRVTQVRDRYFDTAEHAFLAAGYSLRVRNKAGVVIAALKSLTQASGPLHVREEYETTIEPGTGDQPDSWPSGPAADLARKIGRGQPLHLLAELYQERQTRALVVPDAARPAIELSLDQVRLSGSGELFYEIEAEELIPGQEEWLGRLHEALTGQWGLTPQPLSKFERALRVLRPELPDRYLESGR